LPPNATGAGRTGWGSPAAAKTPFPRHLSLWPAEAQDGYSATPRSRRCLIACMPWPLQSDCGVGIFVSRHAICTHLQCSGQGRLLRRLPMATQCTLIALHAYIPLPLLKHPASHVGFALQEIRVNGSHWTGQPAPPTQRPLFASFICTADGCNLANSYVL
jgi:hypothetical protein